MHTDLSFSVVSGVHMDLLKSTHGPFSGEMQEQVKGELLLC